MLGGLGEFALIVFPLKKIPRELKGKEIIFPRHQIFSDLQVVIHRACSHHEDWDIQQKRRSGLLPYLELLWRAP